MPKLNLNPIKIEVLLDLYTGASESPSREQCVISPVVAEFHKTLINAGLLDTRGHPYKRFITPKGNFYVKALIARCSDMHLPVETFYTPKDDDNGI